MPRACFFAHVADPREIDTIEFYAQDVQILESLGFEVVRATRFREIPWDVDVYFAWWWTWAFMPLLPARLRRRPMVVTGTFNHHTGHAGTVSYDERPLHQRALIQAALHGASANVFVSRMEFESVSRELHPTRPLYAPHVVDTDLYSPGPSAREPLVASVCWLSQGNVARKCIRELVEAAAIVHRTRPDVRFVVAGGHGDAAADLAALVEGLGLRDVVTFPGRITQEEKIALLRTAAIYAQPTLFEGFGLAVLEAMSCGATVLSSAVGAVPEVLGDSGEFVDGSKPAAIASSLLRLLDDADERSRLGALARRRAVEEFSFDVRRRRVRELFLQLGVRGVR